MSIRSGWRLVMLALVIGFLAAPAATAEPIPPHDIPGGHDSPIVSRFPGSTMVGYRTVDLDQVTLPMGTKISTDQTRLLQTETVIGKVTQIAYAMPSTHSAFEVYQNYRAALAKAGFVTRFQCENAVCGDNKGTNLDHAIATTDLLNRLGQGAGSEYGNLMIWALGSNGGPLFVQTSRLTRPQGNVDVSLLVCSAQGQPNGALLQIVEEKPLTTGLVTVDAKTMGQSLAQNGHIALYGIHFATDSAALTADSAATLAQMVDLLKAQPQLKVYIVGHTDDTGTLAHNLALSQQRADSVVKALEGRGIAAPRLAAKGLASYAPVASNATDAGRAQNRRVELVQQ